MRPHGNFTTYIDDQVLVSEVRGQWNIELLDAWFNAMMPHIEEISAKGLWGTVGVMHDSLLCSREALETLAYRAQIAVDKRHLVCSAFVAKQDVEGRNFIEPVYEKFYKGVCPIQFFDNYGDAKAWVVQQCADAAKEGLPSLKIDEKM